MKLIPTLTMIVAMVMVVPTGYSYTPKLTSGPAPVDLGSAGTFAVLAGSTVTSTGATTVNGDLGVSPGTAVNGFPPGTVNGTQHVGDPIAAQAQLDLTTAYNDAAGRTVDAVTIAGNIGGQTLPPGLYKSTSSVAISSGDLTLDAQGDENAVFIFQVASTLTTTAGRQVILSGGAQASNIFWQIGSSATLGTTTVFKGTIMAAEAITLTTGATLDGRALARTAAVTLDANIITTGSTSTASIDSGDYNGDGTSDIAIFRRSSGLWAVKGLTRVYFGHFSDSPVPGDYNGNGTTDIGIFRPSDGLWAIRGVTRVYFGALSDIPVPGDYTGDSSCEQGIFRGSSGLWAIRNVTRAYFGASGDKVAPGYYDGSGRKLIGIFRGSSGLWAIRSLTRFYFGGSADSPVPVDYDGNGSWEGGIFRPSSGLWAVRGLTRVYFGGGSDQPVPADYQGDGRDDIGIFRDSSGLWAISGISRVYFGATGDVPVTR